MKISDNYPRWSKFIFISYMILILYLSCSPHKGPDIKHMDKIKHVAAFFVFALLQKAAYTHHKGLKIFLGGTVFGSFIEIIQHFLPYRTMDLLDMASNSLGLIIGIFLIYLLEKRLFPQPVSIKKRAVLTEGSPE